MVYVQDDAMRVRRAIDVDGIVDDPEARESYLRRIIRHTA